MKRLTDFRVRMILAALELFHQPRTAILIGFPSIPGKISQGDQGEWFVFPDARMSFEDWLVSKFTPFLHRRVQATKKKPVVPPPCKTWCVYQPNLAWQEFLKTPEGRMSGLQ